MATIQQIKRELEGLKQKTNYRNSQVEYILLNAQEELIKEINRISGRLRDEKVTCVLSEADKEELFNTILENSNEVVKNPYFEHWVKWF